MVWTVYFTSEAEEMFQSIKDRRIRKLIINRAQRLALSPDLQGKALGADLEGLRSVRAVGRRYRIIYELFAEQREVWIVAIGIRKAGTRDDIYELAKKLIR
jgi:mRNA interferase RelE/StbE